MHYKVRSLFTWILANALAWSIGWLAYRLIGWPLGSWIYGGIIWGSLALALRKSNFSVATWAVAGSLIGLLSGFEGSLLSDDSDIVRIIGASSIAAALSLPLMVLPLLLMLIPLGIVWALNFLLVPRPGESPRKQLVTKHAKSALEMALVWISVCVGGGIIGTAIGISIRSVGIAFGWSTMIGFNVGGRLIFGIIVGLVTGLAALRASRPSMTEDQR